MRMITGCHSGRPQPAYLELVLYQLNHGRRPLGELEHVVVHIRGWDIPLQLSDEMLPGLVALTSNSMLLRVRGVSHHKRILVAHFKAKVTLGVPETTTRECSLNQT